MSGLDYAIIAVIGLSAVFGLLRGFVRGALSLFAWIAGFWAAWRYAPSLSQHLSPSLDQPSLRMAAAFALIFLAVLLVFGAVNYLIARAIANTGIAGPDRVLGMLFGCARGVLLVAILVLLAGLTPFPRDAWWHASVLVEPFQTLALWLGAWLPHEFAASIRYS